MDYAKLFALLLHAEAEDEVTAILLKSGYLQDDAAWQPLGDMENNFGAVSNQQTEPTAALVEKVINSIDAVLMAACYEKGIDPEGQEAPPNMAAAVQRFFGVPDGKLNRLDDQQQRGLAERINLVAVGDKANPNYLIIDSGEGQTPAKFPATFLSLMRSNKMRIPFVQGKFNSGGTGVLLFCGNPTCNYQLIVSRRHPRCPNEPGDVTADLWGFTIVRRMLPAGGRRSSMYVYLAPDGTVPSFAAHGIKVLPGRSSKNQPPPPYAIDLLHGTCVKLYDFRWKAKSTLTTEGRFELEQYLHSPCLPFRVTETRDDYKANYYSATVIGGWNSVLGGDESDHGDKLEPGFPAYADLDLAGLGRLPYAIAVFNETVKIRRVPHGVFFLVNGQVHGELPANFITNRLKFDYLKNLLVAVDCTAMDERVREDFFMASRDRVRRNEAYIRLEEQLALELKNHKGLDNLNQLRRQRELEKHLTDDAPLSALQALVDSDPSLASLFSTGDRLATATGPRETPPFVGRQFPTFFRLAREPESGLTKTCPVNHTCVVDFETDATNDYFMRSGNPGEIQVDPPNLMEHSRLWNGAFEARFRVPWDAQPGQLFDVTVTVRDMERDAISRPFVSVFKLKVITEVNRDPKPGPPSPSRGPHPDGNTRSVSLALPKTIEVRKRDWEEYDPPLTEFESVRLLSDGNSGFDCLLNVDNRFLLTELGRARPGDRGLIKYWFQNGLVISAVGMLKHQQRVSGDSPGSGPDLAVVSQYCSGMAQVIVPIIRALSKATVI